MVLSISIQAGFWLIPLCMAIGAGYAAILYLYEKKYEFTAFRRAVLATLRALTVALLVYFLFSPMLQRSNNLVDKPLIIFAQDNSSSIVATKDSAFMRSEYPNLVEGFIDRLGDSYDVRLMSFGQAISDGIDYSFSQKQTDIASVMTQVGSRFTNRNVGAMIIASDGIINQGVHPYYAVQQLGYPIFTVALGDTSVRRDAVVSRVLHNRIAYKGNIFPIEVHVQGQLCQGLTSRLQVKRNDKILYAETVTFSGSQFNKSIPVEITADETGIHRYSVSLQPVEGETNLLNNVREIFVEVLEGKQKILLLYDSPHPDVSALRQAIESFPNIELNVSDIYSYSGDVSRYNLAILHQLPSVRSGNHRILQLLREQMIPMLFVIGSATSADVFNSYQTGAQVSNLVPQPAEAIPVLNTDFGAFVINSSLLDFSRNLPPLYLSFNTVKLSGAASVLFRQQVGSLVTDLPLIATSSMSGYKYGIIAGEGIWRWRINDFVRNHNHLAFNDLTGKLIQYLSIREEKSRFRVNAGRSFEETESIEFTAEYYNSSYEAVNTYEAEMIITDEDGREFTYTFSPVGNSYYLDIGSLQPGNYSFVARIAPPNESFTSPGVFSVSPAQLELMNLTADHTLMFGLAQRHGGQMFYPQQLDALAEAIENRHDIRPLIHREISYHELIDITWLLALIVFLIALEWVGRRTAGAY